MSNPQSSADPAQVKPARVSEILHRLTVGDPEARLTFGDLRHEFSDRAFGLLLLVFALPNCIPIPGIPGFSFVTGLPVVFFAFQLALGQQEPYLPKWLRDRSFSRGQLAHIIVKAGPYLRWVERMITPRMFVLTEGLGERVLGIVTLILAIALTAPIPLGNLLPSIALALLSLALIERDGLLAIMGYLMSTIAFIWLLLLFTGAEELAGIVFHWK